MESRPSTLCSFEFVCSLMLDYCDLGSGGDFGDYVCGPWGTVPELLLEKKGLIFALQELIVHTKIEL